MEPGDILYIPSCFGHMVEVQETSISYNVWFSSIVTDIRKSKLESAVSKSLNKMLKPSWPPALMVACAREFVRAFIFETYRSKKKTESFVTTWFEQRYKPSVKGSREPLRKKQMCKPFQGNWADAKRAGYWVGSI